MGFALLLVGALAAWALTVALRSAGRVSSLETSLEGLQRDLRALRRTQSAVAPMAAADPSRSAGPGELVAPLAPVAASPPPLPKIDQPLSQPAAPSTSAAGILDAPPAGGAVVPPPLPPPLPRTPAAAPAPRLAAIDPLAPLKEWLLGGNTIVKAGIGILFIGLAFLAKYATQHVHVPIEFRLAGIGAVAMVLLVIGWRLRLRRPGYGQALQGGAVAVLYLTLFVAFRFYGVIAVGPVFALMAAVAALSAALAVLQDARALAVIGALGGFAAPILVSTGSGNHIALFSYYLVLDLGIAAVAWHKTWRSLNLVGFFGTFLIGTSWGVLKYQSENYASSQGFLIAFFLLFVAILLMPARQKNAGEADGAGRAGRWVNGSLLFGLPTIAFALQYGLVRQREYGAAISALVLAAFYVLLSTWLRRQPRFALVFEGSLAIGTVFLTLVIPFALDARSTAGAWALEGAGLVWLGWRQSRLLARALGYLLLLLAGVSMMVALERYDAPASVWNATLFNALMAAAASLAAAYFVHRGAAAAGDSGEGVAEPLLISWGTLWLLFTAGVEIHHFVKMDFVLAVWLTVVSAVALAYTALSQWLQWPRVAAPVLGHAMVLAIGVAISAVTQWGPLEGGGAWAWPLALATHAIVLWRAAPQWSPNARTPVHVAGVLVVGALGALEGRTITTDWGDASSAWPWLGWLVVPAMLLLWLPRPSTARVWPVRAAAPAYQSVAAGLLSVGLLVWTVLANFSSDGSASPLPHVPLVNPLDLGIATALFATWRWSRSAGVRDAVPLQGWLPVALFSGTAFVWINAMLVRGFHHYDDVPYRVAAWTESLAVQTGLTLLWATTALALMWISAHRSTRVPWIVGAVLLAAVVMKLLLVDLSGSGTVTRIVSFIGAGVLMLVIGYVAPLPSARDESVKEHHAEN